MAKLHTIYNKIYITCIHINTKYKFINKSFVDLNTTLAFMCVFLWVGDTGLWYVCVCVWLPPFISQYMYFSAISYLFMSAPFILSLLSSTQIFPPHWLSHCSGVALDLCSWLERRTLTWGGKIINCRDANCSFFAVFSTFFKLQILVILSKMPQNTFFQGSLCVHFYGNQMKITVFQAKILFFILTHTFFFRGWHLCNCDHW